MHLPFKSHWRSLLVGVLLTSLSVVVYAGQVKLLVVALAWSLAVAFAHSRMESSGRYSRWRTFFFLSLAVFFWTGMQWGGMAKPDLRPYCHVGMAGNFIHVLHNQVLSILHGPWSRYGALSLGILWLLVVLVAGGAFCSHICFFGGIDDSVSQVLKKPLIKVDLGSRVREFQLAILLFIAFVSFMTTDPEFCHWLCPFKDRCGVVSRWSEHATLAAVTYFSVAAVFLLALPLLTKKRFFCSALCPFGAIPPLLSVINPYKVTLDKDKCTDCGKCAEACPSFALEKKDGVVSVNRYCTHCMRCAAACPKSLIKSTLFHKKESRLLPFISVAFGGALSLFYVPQGFWAMVKMIGGLCK